MTLKDAFFLLPLLVIYTSPISNENPFLRPTFYDIALVFLALAVVQQRHKFHIRQLRQDWTRILLAYSLVIGMVLAKEPDVVEAFPAIGGVILGVVALFVMIGYPTRFLASRMVNAWLVGLAVTAAVAFTQIGSSARATGLFRFPNELGTYGVATVALLIAAHYFKSTSGRKFAAGMAGAGLVLLASGGRASIASALVLVGSYAGLYVFGSSHNFAKSVGVVVPVIIVAILLGAAGSTGFNITETISDSAGVSSRRVIETWQAPNIGSFFSENWGDAWTLFRGSPAIGWPISEATVDSSVLAGRYSVHNTPLSLLVNYGLIGVVLLASPLLMLRRNGLFPPRGLMVVLGVGFVPVMLYHDLAESRSVWLALAIITRLVWEVRVDSAIARQREEEMAAEPDPPSSGWSPRRRRLGQPRRLRY